MYMYVEIFEPSLGIFIVFQALIGQACRAVRHGMIAMAVGALRWLGVYGYLGQPTG